MLAGVVSTIGFAVGTSAAQEKDAVASAQQSTANNVFNPALRQVEIFSANVAEILRNASDNRDSPTNRRSYFPDVACQRQRGTAGWSAIPIVAVF